MTDWGVHLLDYGLLGMNSPVPKTVSALGGRFAYPELYEETPDTLTTLYEFDGFNMVWDSAMGIDNGSYNRDHGIAYIGNNGTLILNRGGWEVIEERRSKDEKSNLDRHIAGAGTACNVLSRQGKGGRTFLVSPLTAAATAVAGVVTDVRTML